MRAEWWDAIPGCRRACDADDKAQEARNHGVKHGPLGSEHRDNVASQDAVDEPVRRGDVEEIVGHGFADSRENAGKMHKEIGKNSQTSRNNDAG
ncbi:MAG TPA: hypothetical protein VJN42_04165 [Candidatus Acidoferrum sp.]|nr:hypothetical protein [Candidatus Acidoferrum sp.]